MPCSELSAPAFASVSFSEEAHQAQFSADDRGLALKVGSDHRIYRCPTVEGAAPAFARELMLPELAHLWMWQNLKDPIRAQFLARVQLPTWDATDVPWDQRGIEHAPPSSRGAGRRTAPESAARQPSLRRPGWVIRVADGAAPLQPPFRPTK